MALAAEVGGKLVNHAAINAANHVLAPSLHRDQPRLPKLFEVEGDGGGDLLAAGHVAADLAGGRSLKRAHVAGLADGDGTAALAQELEDAEARRVAQRLEQRGQFCCSGIHLASL